MTRIWIILFFLLTLSNFSLERKKFRNEVHRYYKLAFSFFPSRIEEFSLRTMRKFDKFFFSMLGTFILVSIYSVWKETFAPILLAFFLGMAIISAFQLAVIDALDKTK